MLAVAAAALLLATRAPLATTVLGLIAFGVLHNVLEIRYVAGRFAPVLSGRFLELLLILITGIVLCRLTSAYWPTPGRYAEIVLGYVVLLVGARPLRGFRSPASSLARLGSVGVIVLLLAACVASLAFPAYYFVILTHLHNLVPLVFLWEWARRIRSRIGRHAFRFTQVLWIVILPLVILAGAFDRFVAGGPGVVERFVGAGSAVVASATPPALVAQMGVRFLVMFAFMQTMHYVVWVGFLPKFAPDATAAFESRVRWLRGGRAWALGIGGGLVLAAVFLTDYFQGKAIYAALASYHAYLEFPVLLALLLLRASGRRASS